MERQSTISEKRLLGEAFKRGIGQVSPEAIQKEYESRKDILFEIDPRTKNKVITTQAALDEEKKLTQNARQGRGKLSPINPTYQVKNDQLTNEQRKAVHHALASKDFMSVITGDAGTGKTWSIKEVAEGYKEKGVPFSAFAPSAKASRGVQRQDGFKDATTIASFLDNKELQDKTKNGCIWIDEAGMVGNKTMNSVIDIAKKQNARILLTGDVKQHNSVERGDALRVIQEYGGVKPAYITKIQRQKTNDYKQAVDLIAKGKVEKGYQALDNMGAIKERIDMQSLKKDVANEYVNAIKQKDKVLLVATTHAQGEEASGAIRDKLKEEGLLSKKEKAFTIHKNKSLTDAQKKDTANYDEGLSIQFHQNIKGGFKRGSRFDVIGKDDKGNIRISEIGNGADKKKKEYDLPLDAASKFSVYENRQLKIAEGDAIRITQNGFSNENKRLNNGNLLSVKGFDKKGNILASTGRKEVTLDKEFRNFTHGYYTTSQGSQGTSVNKVIMMQSSASGKASSKEQFYVSASRGKYEISIYTDDKKHLLHSVQQSTQRKTATQIAKAHNETQKQFTVAKDNSASKTEHLKELARTQRAKEENIKKENFKKQATIRQKAMSKAKDLWQKSKTAINNFAKEKPIVNVQPKAAPIKSR